MNAPIPTKARSRKRKFISISFLLVLALIILGVLIYVTTISQSGCGDDQSDVAQIFVTSEIDTALLAYKTNTGSYPTTQLGLQALIIKPDGVKNWRGPYLTTDGVPKDPWANYYHYAFPSTHGQPAGKYDCWSLGPDGLDGTADDIGNWPKSSK